MLEALDQSGLLASLPPATSVTCRACVGDHDVEVWRDDDGDQARFWHCCPESGLVQVQADRLGQWRANIDGLVVLIQAALGNRARRSIVVPERVWMWQGAVIDGRPRTVWFVRGHGWPDGEAIASRVRATAETVILVSDPPSTAPQPLQTGRIISLWQIVDQDEEDAVIVDAGLLVEAATGSPATSPTPREPRHRRRGGRDEAVAALTNALVRFLTDAQRQLAHQGKADAQAYLAYQPPTQKALGSLAGIRIHTRVGRALKDASPGGKYLRLLWEAAQTPEGVMEFRLPGV
ncbi:hypothetical protein LBMAG53_39110 [Planctomycetota bacterium]|nr:hypothetical protein LBMAG53_39110 [Planctomycetota bacterium]